MTPTPTARWFYQQREGPAFEITAIEPADVPGFHRAVRVADGVRVWVHRDQLHAEAAEPAPTDSTPNPS